MADVTPKKNLIVLFFILNFSITVFGQKNVKFLEFSNEFPAYLSELNNFMTSTNNEKLISDYRRFSKNSQTLSDSEKLEIINISNKMLSKRLKPNPHFSRFLSAIVSVNNCNKRKTLLIEWLHVFRET